MAVSATITTASLTAHAAPLHAEQQQWPVPIDILTGRAIVAGEANRRKRVCNLGEYTAATQPVPIEHDPMFRRLPDDARQEMAAILKRIDSDTPDATAQADLARLIAGANGAAMVREGIRVESTRWRTALVRAALPMAAKHPRLAALFHNATQHADPAYAAVVATFLYRTDCDSPAMFGHPIFEHASAEARITGVDEQIAHMSRNSDLGFQESLRTLFHREKSAEIRIRILRGLAWLQTPGLLNLAETALKDRDPGVRAEARVFWAQMTTLMPNEVMEAARRDKAAVVRLGYVRALAGLGTRTAMRALEQMRQDRGVVSDPIDKRDYVVGDVATTLLAQLRGAPAPSHPR